MSSAAVPVCTRRIGVCGKIGCANCLPRSLAALANTERLKCWLSERNGGLQPEQVALHGYKKYFFRCNREGCGHMFSTKPNNVADGRWCPFCVNQQRCTEPDCEPCRVKSFASFWDTRKVASWLAEKNHDVMPRDVGLNCTTKYWFCCDRDECGNEFYVSPCKIVQQNSWCPLCRNKNKTEPSPSYPNIDATSPSPPLAQ